MLPGYTLSYGISWLLCRRRGARSDLVRVHIVYQEA